MRLNGRYLVERVLGRGSHALVVEVADESDGGRRLAAKVLTDGRDSELLRWEFAQLRTLDHPNLARALGLETVTSVEGEAPGGVLPGALLLTQELVEGRPADEGADALPPEGREAFAVAVAGALCRALEHLHARGIVHRDVKPANVIVGDLPGSARLVDLALSSSAGAVGDGAAGTVAFMAPEAMAAAAEARSDLFSLGATLFRMIAGRLPFGDPSDVQGTVAAVLSGRSPDLGGAAPAPVAEGLSALVASLLARDPARRPATAQQVLLELARLFGPEAVELDGGGAGVLGATLGGGRDAAPVRGPRSGAVIGRTEELDQLSRLVDERLDALGDASMVVAVTGAPGVGKSALVRELGQRLQLRAAASGAPTPAVLGGPLDRVVRALRAQGGDGAPEAPLVSAWLGEARPAGEAAPDGAALCDEMLSLAMAAARARPTLVHLETCEEGLAADLVAYAHRLGDGRLIGRGGLHPQLVVIAESRSSVAAEPAPRGLPAGVPTVDVRPLAHEAIAAIVADRLREGPPPELLEAAIVAARGRPALLHAFLSRVLGRGLPVDLDEEALAELELGEDGAQALAAAVADLAEEQREALIALAIFGRQAGPQELARLLEVDLADATERLGRLWREGWITVDEEGRCEARGSDLVALSGTLAEGDRQGVHRRALAILDESAPEDLPGRARHAIAAGLGAEAGALSLEAGEALLAAGDPRAAAVHLEAAAEQGGRGAARRARLLLRRAMTAAGCYDRAARLATEAVRRREPGARLDLARTLRLAGDPEAAAREGARAARSKRGALAAKAILARLALDRGDAREALSVLGEPRAGAAEGGGAADVEEVAGLARLALGEEEPAREHFEACLALRAERADAAALARAHNLLGMVAHHRGEWAGAAERYAEAFALARRAGHAHAAATYGVNLASCRVEAGDLGAAAPPLERSVTTLAGMGREDELAGALFNYGTLLLALGDVEGAGRAHERALGAARRAGARRVEAYCELLGGDLLRRTSSAAAGASAYERATVLFGELSAPRERALARLALAEARAEAGDRRGATDALEGARADGGESPSPELRRRRALTLARLALRGCGDPHEAAVELAAARPELARGDQRELLWRAEVLAARLALAEGDRGSAAGLVGSAAQLARMTEANVPDLYRPTLRTDPDRAELRRLEGDLGAAAGSIQPATPGEDPAVLRRLLAINKRLNSELRLRRLLDEIMDTVVDLTDAERGFLLLRESDGSLSPRSARNIERTSLTGEDLALSRSIAERVIQSGAPVLTVDAQADGRFGAASSVHALRLRSILAVPLRVKGEVVGAVYVDDRLRPGAFDEGARRVLQHVADQAAIAIDNARLIAENKRRQRKIEALNRDLQRELDRQKVELEELRRELDGQRAGLRTKYSYDAIVARSAPMEQVFRVLDRVTDSEVPVVIQGDSGTGKELVARAIHWNGPRQDHAFVSENCGAIPETLLESVLFGHVRGAFTGADRTRPGLFEVASKGTLLLDEVSEMSPAMQAKLLRVLQEGEVRLVGGDRPVKVDVRVIASANRDLGELVRTGEFREDLYYRLNVITVRLPPLRERAEDIPLLVEHFLAKHGAGRVGAVDRAALRRLTAYHWPGNVRQLENEIMRASVLADDVIRQEHLSPEICDATPGPGRRADDLDLKGQVEDLERSLLVRALSRFRGNQSKASKALGVSRFGLQKKLKRLGIDPKAL